MSKEFTQSASDIYIFHSLTVCLPHVRSIRNKSVLQTRYTTCPHPLQPLAWGQGGQDSILVLVKAHRLRSLVEEEAQGGVAVFMVAHMHNRHRKEVVEGTRGEVVHAHLVALRPRASSSQGVVLEGMQVGDRPVVECGHNNTPVLVVEVGAGLARLPPDHPAL